MTKQNIIRQSKNDHIEGKTILLHGNPTGGKESEEQAQEPESHSFSQSRAP